MIANFFSKGSKINATVFKSIHSTNKNIHSIIKEKIIIVSRMYRKNIKFTKHLKICMYSMKISIKVKKSYLL